MFENLPPASTTEAAPAAPDGTAPAFCIWHDSARPTVLAIVPSHCAKPTGKDILWSGLFESEQMMAAVLLRLEEDPPLLCLWGRFASALEPRALDSLVSEVVEKINQELKEAEAKRLRHEQDWLKVSCYVQDAKNAYSLTLQRKNQPKPEWSITFSGRAERERLRDWMRWQGGRFFEFLEHARREGSRALELRLIEEMHETEIRLKKSGRTTPGIRPLRMWRGDA